MFYGTFAIARAFGCMQRISFLLPAFSSSKLQTILSFSVINNYAPRQQQRLQNYCLEACWCFVLLRRPLHLNQSMCEGMCENINKNLATLCVAMCVLSFVKGFQCTYTYRNGSAYPVFHTFAWLKCLLWWEIAWEMDMRPPVRTHTHTLKTHNNSCTKWMVAVLIFVCTQNGHNPEIHQRNARAISETLCAALNFLAPNDFCGIFGIATDYIGNIRANLPENPLAEPMLPQRWVCNTIKIQ